jgi:hypothetical protein
MTFRGKVSPMGGCATPSCDPNDLKVSPDIASDVLGSE